VRTFTLDTSCIIHAVQDQAQAEYIEALVEAARAGTVSLFLTVAFSADMSRASSENLDANLAWLAGRPIAADVPGPFRLDYSTLDGGDVLVSGEQAALITAIEHIVLPAAYQVGNLRADDPECMFRWSRKVNDVQHLAAHIMAGHDAFVTSDEDDILKKRDRLRSASGIVVLTLEEACTAIGGW
jgi:hypothetical protein